MLHYKLMVFSSFCYLNFAKEISVKINDEQLINTVSDNFLSFEWNPTFLIDNELELSQFFCYSNVLSPAYVKVTNLVVDHLEKSLRNDSNVILSEEKLKKIIHLLNGHNFTPLVSVNILNQSPNIGWKQIFSLCERIGVNNFVWQLDCRNQTFNEYIKDIQNLKEMDHKSEEKSIWKEMGSDDILKCSELNSAINDFEVLLPESNVLLNTVAMNRNEFELFNKLTDKEKESIKNIFNKRNVSMWENFADYGNKNENDRALIWLKNIGMAAKMGYSTIFKEIKVNDLKYPSLSYFITVLHKVYVDKKVLDTEVSYNSQNVSLFAHCVKKTSNLVSNGIVLYAVNEDNSEIEILLDIDSKPDVNILSFILHQTANSIIINGKNVTENDDIRNIVQMIKPSKMVKVTLPSKSVGFWVLPHVNIDACSNVTDKKLMFNVNRRQEKGLHETESQVSRNLVDNSNVDKNINNFRINLKDLDEETLSKLFESGENINSIKNEKISTLLNMIEKANFTTHAVEVGQILYAVDELLNLQNKIIDIGNNLLYVIDTGENADNLNSEIYNANNKSMGEFIFNSTRIKRHTNNNMQVELSRNKENKTELVDTNKSVDLNKLYSVRKTEHKMSNSISTENLKVENKQAMKIPLTNSELKTVHMKIKNDFLKQEARMSEMQKEIKSKILELRNEAIIKPHKIVKREEDGESFIKNGDNTAQTEQSEISLTILSNLEKIKNIGNNPEKIVEKIQGNTISSENKNEHVPKSEKLVWEDLSNSYNKLKEDMNVFYDIGGKINSILTNMKSTVSDWWKNITS